MNLLLLLFIRIAAGEKYRKSEKRDVLLWGSVFAAFPIAMMLFLWMFNSAMDTAGFWGLWVMGVAEILMGAAIWFAILRSRSLLIISTLAVLGWTGLYFVVSR